MTRRELLERVEALRDECGRAADPDTVALLEFVARHLQTNEGVTAAEPTDGCAFCQNDGSRCWVCQPD